MNLAAVPFSQDACNDYLLGAVMEATAPRGETAATRHGRLATITEMFRTFEPANAVEAMIACHCITLQFVLNAAMRDAGDVTLDAVLLTRMRASAMAISKTLALWISKYRSMHNHEETRAAPAPKSAPSIRAEPSPPKPPSQSVPRPPAPIPPRPTAPEPSPLAALAQNAPALRLPPGPPAARAKEALLSSAAILPGAPPNGRMCVPPPT